MNIDRNRCLLLASASGASAVMIGAFGAHGLDGRISDELLQVYQAGVLYHLIHAIAILALAFASDAIWNSKWAGRCALAWTLGILIFSGSLYLLAITDVGILGAITPIGGVAFIAGWLMIPLLRSFET